MKSFTRSSFFLLVVSSLILVNADEKTETKKDDSEIAKRYREKEPVFQPPPIPIQRRLQVNSGAEHPPSFFGTQQVEEPQPDKLEARQFNVQPAQAFQQTSFNNFQQQPQQQANFQQPQQRQEQPRQNFQQFNQPQQNFQFPQEQRPQPAFQDPNNFQTRQQETLPTLPPVFIPPNQPVGPPPNPQSPIRNLFREPEPQFSLTGLFQRFLRLFNFNNN